MKGKKLILILALLVVCLAAYFAVKHLNLNGEDNEGENADYINQMETDTITGFSFVSNGETLAFTKDGDIWKYDGNGALTMNQISMNSMVSMLAEIQAKETLTEHETLSEYGLETPSNTIKIISKAGTKELLIGNENTAADGYYAMINGEDTVYLIASGLPEKFNCTLDTLVDMTEEETTSAGTGEEATGTDEGIAESGEGTVEAGETTESGITIEAE